MATRKDIAKMANVSEAVVSYVLNNSNYVSAEKRERVLQAVKKLNYQPNRLARSLKTKKTYLMVIIVNEIRNEFFADIAYEMEKHAYAYDYTTLVCNARNDEKFISNIINYQVDGVFIYSNKLSAESINRFAERNIPTVVAGDNNFWYEQLDERISTIMVDAYQGVKQSVQYLIDKGHRRIGYLHTQNKGGEGISGTKISAYIDALKENEIAIDTSLITFDLPDLMFAQTRVTQLLSLPNPPTAFAVSNDVVAVGVMQAIKDMGLRIPEDVAVIGYDDIMIASLLTPGLTTVNTKKKEVGHRAVEMLIQKIRGSKTEKIIVQPTLVERGSV